MICTLVPAALNSPRGLGGASRISSTTTHHERLSNLLHRGARGWVLFFRVLSPPPYFSVSWIGVFAACDGLSVGSYGGGNRLDADVEGVFLAGGFPEGKSDSVRHRD